MSLEEIMNLLAKYGDPSLRVMNHGWYCAVQVFDPSEGIRFDVRSDFDHATSMEAANLCMERLNASLSRLATRGA